MNIDHEQMQELLHAYVDGEVDSSTQQEIEQHIRRCEDCLRIEEQIRSLHLALTSKALAYRAPVHLRKNVRAALRQEASPERETSWSWLAFASGAVCAGLLAAFVLFQTQRSPGNAVADQAVDNHVRSLLAAHLVDVRSSDQHTVKPWFDGKIDFAPPVRDLGSNGFPLAGGRLDYLGGKTIAALVYKRNKHPINLFIAPAPAGHDAAPALTTRRGYNVLHWTHGEMNYWAVSDLNAEELKQFAELLKQ
jgi:anti-sigma factor RsiW